MDENSLTVKTPLLTVRSRGKTTQNDGLKNKSTDLPNDSESSYSVMSDLVGDKIKQRSSTTMAKSNFALPMMFMHIREALSPTIPNPLPKASFIGRWLFTWTNHIIDLAKQKLLKNNDLYTIGKAAQIPTLEEKFNRLKSSRLYSKSDDIKVARGIVMSQYNRGTIYYLLSSITEFSIPALIKWYFVHEDEIKSADERLRISLPFIVIFLMTAILIIRFLLFNQAVFNFKAAGARFSSILRHRVFQKLSSMPMSKIDKYTEVSIVALTTLDVDNCSSGMLIFPDFVNSFILFVLGFALFSQEIDLLGLGILTALLVMAILLFRGIHKKATAYKTTLLEINDDKSKLIKLMIQDISLIKCNQLENLFYRKIVEKHLIQNKLTKKLLSWTQSASVISFYLPHLFTFVIFAYVILSSGRDSLSERGSILILTIISIIKAPINSISDAFRKWPFYTASKTRMLAFLNEPDRHIKSYGDKGCSSTASIDLKNCYFVYNLDKKKEASDSLWVRNLAELNDINLSLENGDKYALAADNNFVASSMLMAITKEMELLEGRLNIKGKVVYQAANMHFVEDTLKQNIMMGMQFDERKYQRIVEMIGIAALFKDESGIENQILSETTKEISTDLKKMIILARIIYQDGNIILLNGFLDLFPYKYLESVLPNILENEWKDKIVLVSTSRELVAKLMKRVIIMKKGTIDAMVKHKDIQQEELLLFDTTIEEEESNLSSKSTHASPDMRQDSKIVNFDTRYARSSSQIDIIGSIDYKKKLEKLVTRHSERANYFKSKIKKKIRMQRTSTLWQLFLFNSGYVLPIIMVCLAMLTFGSAYFFSWFVSSWKGDKLGWSAEQYLQIYAAISLVSLISSAITAKLFVVYFRRIAVKMFIYLIKGILNHSWEWFSSTSKELLLSRCITEFTELDEKLAPVINVFYQQLIRFHIVFAIVLYRTYFTGFFIILIYCMIQYYMNKLTPALRAIKNVMISNQSLLIHCVVNYKRGIMNFRNIGSSIYFDELFKTVNEIYQNAKVHQNNVADRWLSTRIYGLLSFVPVLVFADNQIRKGLEFEADEYSDIKLIIALDLVFNAYKLVSTAVSKYALVTILEGLREVIVPDEWSLDRNTIQIAPVSPVAPGGIDIEIDNLVVANPVTTIPQLAGVSIDIQAGSKVAIIGPKGSGKKTILSALMRIIDPNCVVSGSIYLDGRNIKTLSSKELRSMIYYFSDKFKLYPGKLRYNLDPQKEYLDSQILSVLDYIGYFKLIDLETGGMVRERAFSSIGSSGGSKTKIQDIIANMQIEVDLENEAPSYYTNHQLFGRFRKSSLKDQLKERESVNSKQEEADARIGTRDLKFSNDIAFIEEVEEDQEEEEEQADEKEIEEDRLPSRFRRRVFGEPINEEQSFMTGNKSFVENSIGNKLRTTTGKVHARSMIETGKHILNQKRLT